MRGESCWERPGLLQAPQNFNSFTDAPTMPSPYGLSVAPAEEEEEEEDGGR